MIDDNHIQGPISGKSNISAETPSSKPPPPPRSSGKKIDHGVGNDDSSASSFAIKNEQSVIKNIVDNISKLTKADDIRNSNKVRDLYMQLRINKTLLGKYKYSLRFFLGPEAIEAFISYLGIGRKSKYDWDDDDDLDGDYFDNTTFIDQLKDLGKLAISKANIINEINKLHPVTRVEGTEEDMKRNITNYFIKVNAIIRFNEGTDYKNMVLCHAFGDLVRAIVSKLPGNISNHMLISTFINNMVLNKATQVDLEHLEEVIYLIAEQDKLFNMELFFTPSEYNKAKVNVPLIASSSTNRRGDRRLTFSNTGVSATNTSSDSNSNATAATKGSTNGSSNVKKSGDKCIHCDKPGHTEDKCYIKHPALRPARAANDVPVPGSSKAAVTSNSNAQSSSAAVTNNGGSNDSAGNTTSSSRRVRRSGGNISVNQGVTSQFMIKLTANGQVMDCFLDSGADVSLVRKSVVDKLLATDTPYDTTIIYGIDNFHTDTFSTLGAVNLELGFQGIIEFTKPQYMCHNDPNYVRSQQYKVHVVEDNIFNKVKPAAQILLAAKHEDVKDTWAGELTGFICLDERVIKQPYPLHDIKAFCKEWPTGESGAYHNADILREIPGDFGPGDFNEEASTYSLGALATVNKESDKPIEINRGLNLLKQEPTATPQVLDEFVGLNNALTGNTGSVLAMAHIIRELDEKSQLLFLNLMPSVKEVFFGDPQINTSNPVSIRLKPGAVFKNLARRTPPRHLVATEQWFTDMLRLGRLEPGSIDDNILPFVFVEDGDKVRIVLDSRYTNSIIEILPSVLPNIPDILRLHAASANITHLDISQAFYWVALDPASRRIVAVCGPDGKTYWRFTVLPMGLATSAGEMQERAQRLVALARQVVDKSIISVYIDDFIISTPLVGEDTPQVRALTAEIHMKEVFNVLKVFKDNLVKLNFAKCNFARKSAEVLGFLIGGGIIEPLAARRKELESFGAENLRSKKALQRILGIFNFWRWLILIEDYATMVEPMQTLCNSLGKYQRVDPSPKIIKAFEDVKDYIINKAQIFVPNLNRPIFAEADASKTGFGGVLYQFDKDTGKRLPIHFVSKQFNAAQANYPINVKEMLALQYLIRKTKYITKHARNIICRVDHANNTTVEDHKNDLVNRWVTELVSGGCKFYIQPVRGELIPLADALSRNSSLEVPITTATSNMMEPPSGSNVFNNGSINIPIINQQEYNNFRANVAVSTINGLDTTVPTINDYVNGHSATFIPLFHKIVAAQQSEEGKIEMALLLKDKNYSEVHLGDHTFVVRRNSIVVPAAAPDIIKRIIYLSHDVTGHSGIAGTIARIRACYIYWVNMKAQIAAYVNSCDECQCGKTPVNLQNNTLLTVNEYDEVLSYWQLDVLGPASKGTTISGKEIIGLLVGIDMGSRYMVCAPLESLKSSDILEAFQQRIVDIFGVPKLVYNDNGSHFKGEFMDYIIEHNIPHRFGSALHHQSQGAVERAIQTLLNHLRPLVTFPNKLSNWPTVVSSAVFAYNTAEHRGLGMAPYEVVYAKKPRTALEVDMDALPLPNNFIGIREVVALNLREVAAIAYGLYQIMLKRDFDNHVDNIEFKVGDYVLKSREMRPHKMTGMYHGPYKIVALDGGSAKIKMVLYGAGDYSKVDHEDVSTRRLIPYDNSRITDEEICRKRLGVGEELVENITEHRLKDGTVDELQFLVNWKTIQGIVPEWIDGANIKSVVHYKTYVADHQDTITINGKSRVKSTDTATTRSGRRNRK